MSKEIIDLAFQGYLKQLGDTNKTFLDYKNKIADKNIQFPDTAYNLPFYYAITGKKINTTDDIENVITGIKNKNINLNTNLLDLPKILEIGIDVLILQEILLVIKYLSDEKTNFIPDSILRSLGVQLVSNDISGIAVIIGPAKDDENAIKIIRALQEKKILSVLAGTADNKTFYQQLLDQNVDISLGTYIVNLGDSTEAVVLALNWAIRAAMTFGGLIGGKKDEILNYCKNRIPAFAIALESVDPKKVATAVGAIAMGFPIITNFKVPEISITEDGNLKKLLTFELDSNKLIDKCIEVKNIKIKITEIPIPVKYSTAFEGERVRKEDMAVEFGGKGSLALELVISKDFNELENKKISVIGKDVDSTKDGEQLKLAVIVRVAGRKMQKDFEPILERQIHRLLNGAMGIMHIGQRNLVWLRISKEAKNKGFRLNHIGEIIYTQLLSEYGKIVDKIEIDLVTDAVQVEKYNEDAKKIYDERDKRIGEMTDESVDLFYSCLLCQSFAPNHVCIITPERLGLCGAYNWLDGKAAYEINPTGPNQPVKKGEVIDKNLGQWKAINEFVHQYSNKAIEKFSAYSILVDPMTSCGCFECIVAVLPGTGGVMVVDRNYYGMTPSGMTFSTLAGVVGGGKQSPGFIGIGINYIVSKKFISAEGGVRRIVWMSSELKEKLRGKLQDRIKESGVPDLLEKIADEKNTTDLGELIGFLNEKKHPALELGEMI